MYWGYSLGRLAPVFDELRHEVATGNDSLRLAIEYHHGFIEFNPPVLEYIRDLRFAQLFHHRHCPIVLMVRVRQPASFYVSYFRWAVAWRQREDGSKYGSNFTDWAPPNLQSALLLRSMDHMWAENVGLSNKRRRVFWDFDGASMRRLQDMLLHFDLIGTTERFDETLLLVADMTGLQHLAYSINNPTERSDWKRQITIEDACPNLRLCRTHAAAIAPFDAELYQRAAERFDGIVADQGASFQHRLKLFREHLDRRASHTRKNKCRCMTIQLTPT